MIRKDYKYQILTKETYQWVYLKRYLNALVYQRKSGILYGSKSILLATYGIKYLYYKWWSMFTDYIKAAMKRAKYEIIDDPNP